MSEIKYTIDRDRALLVTPDARLEHRAIQVRSVPAEATRYVDELGYRSCGDVKTVAFLQRDDDRVELVPNTIPEHEAFAVQTIAEYRGLRTKLRKAGSGFILLDDETQQDGGELKCALFHHVSTGKILQIIWRKKQKFTGVFPELEAVAT